MALVMVRADERGTERAAASVRLVQDFGRPHGASDTLDVPPPSASEASTPPVPVERGRGRPPGSRNKKPASPVPAE